MKKKLRSILALILSLTIVCSAALPAAAAGEVSVFSDTLPTTHVMGEGDDLRTLLESEAVQDGDIIDLAGTREVADVANDSSPWVIGKAVTFRNGVIELQPGGILLGADVAFENVVLEFANYVRNALIVNGHTLTLTNVTQGSGTREVHLFCGGLSGHSTNAPSGTHGTIIIAGSTSLGNIYAGNISSDGQPTTSALPATITVDASATGKMGVLYACGALETPAIEEEYLLNPDYVHAPHTPSAQNFPVTDDVTVELYQRVIETVVGTTGGEINASVVFNGNGNLCNLTLTDVDISVETGDLAPLTGSTLTLDAIVRIAPSARLDLSAFGDVSVSGFYGGGELVLAEDQTLTISGNVDNQTAVGIGGIFGEYSTGTIDNENIYIAAPNSGENCFILLPSQSNPNAVFTRDGNGNWTVSSDAAEIESVIVAEASVPETLTAETGITSVYLPVSVTYATEFDWQLLYYVPVEVFVNSVAAERIGDELEGFTYEIDSAAGLAPLYFDIRTVDDVDTEVLVLEGTGEDYLIADGTYVITLTIPATHTENGEALTLTTTLTVGETTPQRPENACGENVVWNLSEDGTLTISGTGSMDDYTDPNETPWYEYSSQIKSVVIGEGVTTVGAFAFKGNQSITGLSLPSSLLSIGAGAFERCIKLRGDLVIPENVTTIGDYAFKDCYGFGGTLTLPNSMTSIGERAFYNCANFTGTLTLPSGITEIKWETFALCGKFTGLVIPASVTSIGEGAFMKCSGITGELTIPGTVKTIGVRAFNDCNGLSGTLTIEDGVETIGREAFVSCNGLSKVIIPASVTSMDQRAFEGCPELTTAGPIGGGYDIEFGWTDTIPASAFYDYSNLTYVYIPASITTIGTDAFDICDHLTSVGPVGSGCAIEYGWTDAIPASAFATHTWITSVILAETLTTIGADAFARTNITSIVIPDSVRTLGSNAFASCSKLASITIGSGLTELSSTVFSGCDALLSVEIPAHITSIGSAAFSGCRNLETVKLHEGLTTIGSDAFKTTAVKEIVIPTTVTAIGDFAFSSLAQVCFLGAPPAEMGDQGFNLSATVYFFDTEEWDKWWWKEIDNGLTTVDGRYVEGLTTYWGPNAVSNWRIYSIIAPEFTAQPEDCSVPDGEDATFTVSFTGRPEPAAQWQVDRRDGSGWTDIEGATGSSYTVEDADTSLHGNLYRCVIENYGGKVASDAAELIINAIASGTCGEDLRWILSSDGTLTITGTGAMDNYAFSTTPWYDYRTDIRSVMIGSGVTSIGDFAFHLCTSLTDFMIPANVTSIGTAAFTGSSVSNVVIQEGVTIIGNSAFSSCYNLTSVAIPEGVTTLDDSAFLNCNGLTRLFLPQSLSTVGHWVFDGCSALADVYYCGSEEQWAALQIGQLNESLTSAARHGVIDHGLCGAEVNGANLVWYLGDDGMFFVKGIGAMANYTYDFNDIPTPWLESKDLIQSVILEEGVTTVGDYAFGTYGSGTAFTHVSFPESLTHIGEGSFQLCKGLTELHFGSNLQIIGVKAFNGLNKLTSVEIPGSVTLIDSQAFYSCKALAELKLNEGLVTIGGYAFAECDGLTDVTIPSTVTYIGSHGFYYCDALERMCFLGDQPSDDVTGLSMFPDTTVLYFFEGKAGWTEGRWDINAFSGWEAHQIHAPVFTAQPEAQQISAGGSATFTASFTGVPEPDVQWQESLDGVTWTDIEGATSASYTVENAATELNGMLYRCVIENYGGKVESDAVALTVDAIVSNFTGLEPDENGTWWYYVEGVLQEDFTGLVYWGETFFYVQNGMLDTSYVGLVEFMGAWYYIEGGIINFNFTGLTYWNGTFFYIQSGVLDTSYVGLVEFMGNWYYVEGGIINFAFTGLTYWNGTFFYMQNGVLDTSYVGLVEFVGAWYYVEGGIINFAFTGLTYWGGTFFYIQNGVLDTSYVGLVEFVGAWYYVEGGIINFNFTGLTYFSGTFFYMQNGVLDTSFVGLVEFYGAWYYVSGGIIDFSYTGVFNFNGYDFNVVGGIVQF